MRGHTRNIIKVAVFAFLEMRIDVLEGAQIIFSHIVDADIDEYGTMISYTVPYLKPEDDISHDDDSDYVRGIESQVVHAHLIHKGLVPDGCVGICIRMQHARADNRRQQSGGDSGPH